MLQIKNLTKKYPLPKKLFSKEKQSYKKALDNVSFEMENGLYGLLGPNGAGKSTLINIITGGLKQSSGAVLWNGVSTRKLDKQFRRILGFMPQQQNLYDSFTGKQFLNYMAALKEIKSADVQAEIDRVASRVNLGKELDKKLGAYSGGMKQRLLAAGAIMGSPKLLILDEPTAGLDPKERVRLRELMAEIAQESIVIIATHVVSDVESVADKILLLKEGELINMAAPQELIDQYAKGQGLEEVYLNIFGHEDML
ncbi:MAG: ATP-binding cassette domain-containing protein [Oscillospiraceae bacterium]